MLTQEQMTREIFTISDGTMASITGLLRFSELEQERIKWNDWMLSQSKQFENWQKCWNAYLKANNIVFKKIKM